MRQHSLFRKLLALELCGLLIPVAFLSTAAAAAPAAPLGLVRAVGGDVLLNGVQLLPGATLFEGDRISTRANASSLLNFPNHGQVALDSSTEITLRRTAEGVSLTLLAGRVVVRDDVGRKISVSLRGAEIRFVPSSSSSALCAVSLRGEASVVCSRGEAQILAAGAAKPVAVPAGFRASSSAPAQGAPPAAHAGEVTAVIPQSRIERGAAQMPTAVRSEVLWGDVVRTETRGRVRIGLGDGSVLNVGSHSQLRVVRHEATTQQSELVMQVGKMRVQAQQLGRQGKFEVRTSTAVLGVIGTHFFVEATPTYTRVLVFSGKVRATNILSAIAGHVDVSAGQQTIIHVNQPPTPPGPTPSGAATSAMNETQVESAAAVTTAGVEETWIVVPLVGGAVLAGVGASIAMENKPPVSASGL